MRTTRQAKSTWRAALAVAMLAVMPLLAACAVNSYAGIPFAAGAADPELQALARRAQAGDKHAQLDLGIRYEEGRGVPVDLGRAARLYRMAAESTPLSSAYSLPRRSGGRANAGVLYSGAVSRGLPEAVVHYCALRSSVGSSGVDCANFTGASDLLIAISYDQNFQRCADEAGFSPNTPSGYPRLRVCLVRAAQFVHCDSRTGRSLKKIIDLGDMDSRFSYLSGPAREMSARCGVDLDNIHPIFQPSVTPSSRSITPLDSLSELGRGTIRGALQDYSAQSFLILLCRRSPPTRPYRLTNIEDIICDIAIGRN